MTHTIYFGAHKTSEPRKPTFAPFSSPQATAALRKIPAQSEKPPQVRESSLPSAGSFRILEKPSCPEQEAFSKERKSAALCLELSQLYDLFMRMS